MSKVIILDNGHAGMVGGKYLTPGKRSPDWQFGVLYEGMFNRWVVNLMMRELDYAGVPYYHVSPELYDVSLATRVKRANLIHKKYPNAYLFSLQANAGGGTGTEGFTTDGHTESDEIAEAYLANFQDEFETKGMRMRFDLKDGDRDKEAAFFVLRKTSCPAFLFETGFMDHKEDYRKLWSQDFQQAVACNLAKTAIQLYE